MASTRFILALCLLQVAVAHGAAAEARMIGTSLHATLDWTHPIKTIASYIQQRRHSKNYFAQSLVMTRRASGLYSGRRSIPIFAIPGTTGLSMTPLKREAP